MGTFGSKDNLRGSQESTLSKDDPEISLKHSTGGDLKKGTLSGKPFSVVA